MAQTRRRLLCVGAAAICAALLAVGGSATAHVSTFGSSTTATFYDWDFFFPDPEGTGGMTEDGQDFFSGTVSSPKRACTSEREVFVFRARANRPDKLVGVALSQDEGSWVLFREDPGSGTYYARLKQADIGDGAHDHTCGGDRSPKFEVTDNRV